MDTDKLKLNVLNLCSRIEGKKAIVIEDLKTGEAVEINRDEVFPAASLIKVPVLSALFRMAKENQIALDERIELEKDSRIGGFGILKEMCIRDRLKVSYCIRGLFGSFGVEADCTEHNAGNPHSDCASGLHEKADHRSIEAVRRIRCV